MEISLCTLIPLFMKVSLSPDINLCDWLGLNHQLTNSLISHPGGLSPRVPLYIVSGKWPTTAIGFPLNTKALVSLTAFMACRSVPRVTNACPFIRPSFISRMSKLSAKYTIQAYLWPRKYSLYGTNLKQAKNQQNFFFQGLKKYQSLCMLFIQIKLNSVQIFSENTFHKWQRERQLCKFLQENEKYAPTSLRGLVNFTKILWECEDKDKSVPPQHGKRQADLSIPTRATTGCVSQANYPVPVTGTCTVLWPVVWTSQSDFWSCKTQ